MTKQTVPATPAEAQTLARVVQAANAAEQELQRATATACDCFTMFCEAHGIPGATFVGITESGEVIVTLPETPETPKPDAPKE